MQTDAYQEARYKVPSLRMDYQAQMKLSYYLPNAKGKIVVSGFKERRQWIPWALRNDFPNEWKYFESMPVDRIKNWVTSAKMNYMMTPKTLASLKIAVIHQERAYGTRDHAWEDSIGRRWFDDYRLKGEHLFDYLHEGTLPARDVLVDSLRQYNGIPDNSSSDALRRNPYGIARWFYTYGDFPTWSCQQNINYQSRLDLTHSISKIHELKAGLDFSQYRYKFPYSYTMQTSFTWDSYSKNPYKISSYIQDKIDVSGLIARLGLRFDYFRPRTYTYAEPSNWDKDSIVYADVHYTISPRLGFSLPVTNRMKFRFNYGHYYQFPHLDSYYSWTDTVSSIRLRILAGLPIGNIMLKPQKTVTYEIGSENLLTDDVAIGLTVYYKDIYDLLHVREILALPKSYYMYLNDDYGNVKGFEVSLMKRMSNLWALGINYTLQFAKGTADDDSERIDPVPVIDCWLDFDERHSLHANLDLEIPGTFIFLPIRHLLSSFVISYHSGLPYTPIDLRGNQLGEVNSARMPGYWNVDLKFQRSIIIGPVRLLLSGAIFNLFNTEQVLHVYSTTGEPDDHGDPEPNLDQFGYIPITSSNYSPQVDHNHDGLATPTEYNKEWISMLDDFYENPAYYKSGFKARLGVGIEF
jgi:outer membrane receptor protein involved in Fe transport